MGIFVDLLFAFAEGIKPNNRLGLMIPGHRKTPSCGCEIEVPSEPCDKGSAATMGAPQDDFRVRAADDPASLLVVILDVSSLSWSALTGLPSSNATHEAAAALQSVTEQVLVFLSSFLLLHESNRVCVILASPDGAHLVYPDLPDPNSLPSDFDVSSENNALDATAGGSGFIVHAERLVVELRDAVVAGVKDAFQAQGGEFAQAPAPVSTALATALCIHNRARRIKADRAALSLGQGGNAGSTDPGPCNGRVLLIMAGADVPEQYVPVMNCIFSAQRMGVSLDSCVLTDQDSTYFQQAAHLTNGVCLRPEGFSTKEPSGLIQFLLTVFLVDRLSRDFLAMPTPDKVDFRASCMKTRQIIQDGYTCSVCLSTFATSVARGAAMCPICSARFAVTSRTRRRPPRP